MNTSTYRVIFNGDVVAEVSPQEIKSNLAALFKVDEAVIERRFFVSQPVVVKKDVELHTARKYQQALKKAGLVCIIKPISHLNEPPSFPRSASGVPPLTHTLRSEPKQQAPKKLSSCPKCHFQQESTDTCIRCGIVIERYYERERRHGSSSSHIAPNLRKLDTVNQSFRTFKTVIALFLFLFGGLGGFHWFNIRTSNNDQAWNPDIKIPAETSQRQGAISNTAPFPHKGYRITPLATFSIFARVLNKKNYNSGPESNISPVDLALGWGPMANSDVIRGIQITQANRWYYWRTDRLPISQRDIEIHSANMHIIPANSTIEKELRKVGKGNYIALEGVLVQVETEGGWRWRSSLTRQDTGDGACEIIWVSAFKIVK